MTGNEIVNNFGDAYAVTVEGTEYLIYRDGSYTHAVLAVDAERVSDTEVGDYTAWCDRVPAVADIQVARAIMAEAGITLIHLGDGCCTAVRAARAPAGAAARAGATAMAPVMAGAGARD